MLMMIFLGAFEASLFVRAATQTNWINSGLLEWNDGHVCLSNLWLAFIHM